MGQALRQSFAVSGQTATPARRKSAELCSLHKADLPRIRAEVRRLAPETIWNAFPGPSQRQVCINASKATGASPDTFERLIGGFTASPDLLLLLHVARIAEARTGKQSPLAALVAALIGVKA